MKIVSILVLFGIIISSIKQDCECLKETKNEHIQYQSSSSSSEIVDLFVLLSKFSKHLRKQEPFKQLKKMIKKIQISKERLNDNIIKISNVNQTKLELLFASVNNREKTSSKINFFKDLFATFNKGPFKWG